MGFRGSRLEYWIVVAVLSLAAVGFSAAGGLQAYDSHVLANRGRVADGEVLFVQTGKSAYITVRFRTEQGVEIEGDTSNFVDREEGDQLQVLYDPADPYRFQDKAWGIDYIPAVICLVAGCIFTVWTIYVLRRGIPDWMKNYRR
jgi:hypothetical protein